ncbi:YdaS family helix-turn-helix protein [Pseudomonas sp. 273]|uniref:YdaS family helix-turn-helix protein n=1 Tax=Pseudomonas sp. 273 TaxID=75692 RepID=UPI0023D84F09|nr:YdaS family helix-turn-helix protein [Pseudomonas sp. 273]
MNVFERLVEHFHGQVKTAEALGVKQGTVSGWVSGRHGMSAVTALRAEAETLGAFKAIELCPALSRASMAA